MCTVYAPSEPSGLFLPALSFFIQEGCSSNYVRKKVLVSSRARKGTPGGNATVALVHERSPSPAMHTSSFNARCSPSTMRKSPLPHWIGACL